MQYLTALDDIAPLADQITVRRKGKDGEKKETVVIISPLELNQIGALIYRHQELRAVFDGSGEQESSLYEAIMGSGKEVVRSFVDAATNTPGLGERLTGVEQGRIVLSCLTMTLPEDEDEVADFLDQIVAFAEKAKALARAKRG